MLKSNVNNFVILEKSGGLGGTWRDNKYPGCCCDGESNVASIEIVLGSSPCLQSSHISTAFRSKEIQAGRGCTLARRRFWYIYPADFTLWDVANGMLEISY
jgi:cation diffusion facilitator CzcD-associated flavoprotein CzcO